MTVLAIETSCDETAAAVLRDGALLSSEVSSQIALHECRVAQVVFGPMADRGHAKRLVYIGMALDVIGLIAMAAGRDEAVLLAARVVMGRFGARMRLGLCLAMLRSARIRPDRHVDAHAGTGDQSVSSWG